MTLAIFVFLQTRMNTGGRRSVWSRSHSLRSSSQSPPSIAIGVLAHFSTASGFGLPFVPPRSAEVSCRKTHFQMLK